VRSRLLAVARLLRLIVHLGAGVWQARRLSRLQEPARQEAVRAWLAGIPPLLGVAVRVNGDQRLATGQGPAQLWLPNHVSWMDIPVLGGLAPGAVFLAKSEVRHWPVIGRLASLAGTEFIQRGNGSDAARTAMAHAFDQDRCMVVFAEGTTTDGSRVRRFHARLLGPAVTRGVAVVPIALRYRNADGERTTAAAYVDDQGILGSLWRVARSSGLQVAVEVLPELHAGAEEGRSALAARARAAVASRVETGGT
jgi:1-acyl-sn-glycerol-3-phosphate acyltransferase